MTPQIVAISAVVRSKRLVDITVDVNGEQHRIGHMPIDGWFCVCPRGKRCRHIEHVQGLVPRMENEND